MNRLRKQHPFLIVFLLGVIAAGPATAVAVNHVIDGSQDPDYLFVHTSNEGSFAGKTLILKKVSFVTLVFTDHPSRIAGHLSTGEFVGRFSKKAGMIDADPPNAILSILTGGGAENYTLELKNPKLDGETLQYEVFFFDRKPPQSFGPSSLFIEATFGSPVLE
jgi:hypothetical protein